jgi:hypothetical protein
VRCHLLKVFHLDLVATLEKRDRRGPDDRESAAGPRTERCQIVIGKEDISDVGVGVTAAARGGGSHLVQLAIGTVCREPSVEKRDRRGPDLDRDVAGYDVPFAAAGHDVPFAL